MIRRYPDTVVWLGLALYAAAVISQMIYPWTL